MAAQRVSSPAHQLILHRLRLSRSRTTASRMTMVLFGTPASPFTPRKAHLANALLRKRRRPPPLVPLARCEARQAHSSERAGGARQEPMLRRRPSSVRAVPPISPQNRHRHPSIPDRAAQRRTAGVYRRPEVRRRPGWALRTRRVVTRSVASVSTCFHVIRLTDIADKSKQPHHRWRCRPRRCTVPNPTRPLLRSGRNRRPAQLRSYNQLHLPCLSFNSVPLCLIVDLSATSTSTDQAQHTARFRSRLTPTKAIPRAISQPTALTAITLCSSQGRSLLECKLCLVSKATQ